MTSDSIFNGILQGLSVGLVFIIVKMIKTIFVRLKILSFKLKILFDFTSIVACSCLYFLLLISLKDNNLTLGDADIQYFNPAFHETVTFFCMIVGMMFSYFNTKILYRRKLIEENRKKDILSKPNIDFDFWDFIQPFLVSIITFSFIIGRINSNDVFGNIILGFETGFFWQAVLYKSVTHNAG